MLLFIGEPCACPLDMASELDGDKLKTEIEEMI